MFGLEERKTLITIYLFVEEKIKGKEKKILISINKNSKKKIKKFTVFLIQILNKDFLSLVPNTALI